MIFPDRVFGSSGVNTTFAGFAIAGVVSVGLFARRPADLLILGGAGGTARELKAGKA